MISSVGVPTKPVNGQYITATKALGTAYDDIAVQGLQVYGNQTTSGNTGAAAYITGSNGNLILAPQNSVLISSLQVSSLVAGTVVSTTTNTATSYTATLFMSTPILNANFISSVGISTNVIGAVTGNFSTANISTLNAPNFQVSTLSTVTVDAKVTLTSTLSLLGNVDVNLGLGNQIAGLVGGAAGQALGVGIGGAGLITGAAALITGRTSGGVNSNVFQTINGSTQLQFSTIGTAVSSVFLTTNSLNPLTTPGLEISTTQSVAAGTYCVRSVGDPLYINNNVSSIQMFGQWVPVIQPTATVPALAISSLGVSSINGAVYPPPGGGGGIASTLAISSATINGNFTQSGTGTLNWGGNTLSPTQVVLARPTAVNNTLTTTGAAFLNAGATVNGGLTVASGGATVSGGNLNVSGNAFVTGVLQGGNVQAISGVSIAGGGLFVNSGGIQIQTGNFNMTSAGSVANITNLNVNQNLTVNQRITTNAISTTNISTNNINVFTINNQTYPPPPGPATIPSILNASTINFDGGLTNTGSAPITTGTINVTTVNANNIQSAAISTNILSTNIVRAAAISSFNISTNNINVNTINGAPYSPGGVTVPSTLNASTVRVNGGLTVNNGNVGISTTLGFNNSATFQGSTDFRVTLGSSANRFQFVQTSGNNDAIIMDINADKTTRFYSTLLVRDSTWPSPQPSGASIRTYDTSDPTPYGSVITFNVSTTNINLTTINGAPYIPGGTSIPSTLNASTVNVNGGLTVNNGIVSTLNLQSQTARFFAMSTTFISSGIMTANTIGAIQFSSITGSINTLVTSNMTVGSNANMGSANMGSLFVTSNATMGSISTTLLSTGTIAASNINSQFLTTANINVSSINSAPYPPLALPTGSITIWAGGSDNGASQNFNIPAGWLLCDGSEQDKLVYANLFGVIGNKYAMNRPLSGLNFYLPDLTFAVPMGTPLRNYVGTLNLGAPSFECSVQTWKSDFVAPTSTMMQTWKITQTIGGTLNYGSFFPANAITQPGYPSVYVKQILSYDGNVGYVVVQSVNNSNIPQTIGTITARGSGTVPQDNSGTYLYTLGSYGVESAYPQVTHNQTEPEVATHMHVQATGSILGTPPFGSPQLNGNNGLIPFPPAPGTFQGLNHLSTISTVTTTGGGQNVGTYTAPNFVNMLYIIRT
jgi:hypothetical protein